MNEEVIRAYIANAAEQGEVESLVALVTADEKTRAATLAEFAAGKYAAAEARMKAATDDCERWKKAGSGDGDVAAVDAKP